ncbi:pRL2-8 [Streptomyces sp. NPDC001536]|uniref:pRL2-8 n=1 Tax=Streptomyces sp. NPDC001536 TaxID=3364583 RepID=UPI0036A4D713
MTVARTETPAGECPQCWQHANDRRAHRHLAPREDCPQCVDHMVNGHPYIVPKQRTRRR